MKQKIRLTNVLAVASVVVLGGLIALITPPDAARLSCSLKTAFIHSISNSPTAAAMGKYNDESSDELKKRAEDLTCPAY